MNAKDFQESITQELEAIKNRVRYLIRNRHWGEEGRYKEAILKNLLNRFLPKNLSIGTGFIVNSNNLDQISKQLDIIIYENTYPLLFSEGDFIITTQKNVKGVIEVKSNIGNGNNTFRNVINKFDESIEYENKLFLGIFAFEFNGYINNILTHLNSYSKVNHISLGKNYFIRKWKQEDGLRLEPPIECNENFYNLYEIERLSFSYFISNLLHRVCEGLEERYLFSFPIEDTKESYRIDTICLE